VSLVSKDADLELVAGNVLQPVQESCEVIVETADTRIKIGMRREIKKQIFILQIALVS